MIGLQGQQRWTNNELVRAADSPRMLSHVLSLHSLTSRALLEIQYEGTHFSRGYTHKKIFAIRLVAGSFWQIFPDEGPPVQLPCTCEEDK